MINLKKMRYLLVIALSVTTFAFTNSNSENSITKDFSINPLIETENILTDISGPGLIESGVSGNWTFNSGPLYAWYYKEGSGISGTYSHIGSYHNSLTWTFSNSTSAIKPFMLKVEKLDKHGNVLGNYYYPVTVYPEDCPGQLICM